MSESDLRPIVLFMPARNEARRVADAVTRTPLEIAGHPVVVVVIDDDSRDTTASMARAAGADVIYGEDAGRGASVRLGLADAVERDAVVIAFCGADGEYDPAELELLVDPILGGTADYVVGSRFVGHIERMRVHRRLGNRVATFMVRRFGRIDATDGQSGFRALSAHAAGAAEITHDYDYGPVLTLDLVGKGFRYAEVPISYRANRRSTPSVGSIAYARHMVPAAWRSRVRRRGVVTAPQMTTI